MSCTFAGVNRSLTQYSRLVAALIIATSSLSAMAQGISSPSHAPGGWQSHEQQNPPVSAPITRASGDFWDDTVAPPAVTSEPVLSDEELRVRQMVDEYLSQRESGSGEHSTEGSAQIASLRREWDDFVADSTKKTYPNITMNGVFQADVGWFNQDADSLAQYGRIQDGADFRRARLSAKGSVIENTNYFFQLDFAALGRPTFADVWLEQAQIPGLGTLRVGHWKQPFSLEVVSSFRYTTFMERSLLFIPFTAFRHIGAGFYNHSDDERMTWAASLFRSGQDQFGNSISTDGGWGTAERITYLPLWKLEGEEYLHLGLGHFYNSPPRDRAVFRTIPEFFIGQNAPGAVGTSGFPVPGAQDGTPVFISTGTLPTNFYNVLGTELLWVEGPFSLQSETMVNFVNLVGNDRETLWGSYVQVGYFLTGEHRPYDRKNGAIDRVQPFTNFGFCSRCGTPGCGAWELAGRFSYLDLNDRSIQGGDLTDYTLGVNWYWNAYTKMVFNYVHAVSDVAALPKSHTNMFGMRAQIDF